MARTRPPERFSQLVSAATDVFIHSGGFRRTQIGDVAKSMGVAKGTLYLYVASKEALFDLVLRHADHPELPDPPLPVPTPERGSTVTYLRSIMDEGARFDRLSAAEQVDAPASIRDELAGIVDEIYEVLRRHRRTIRLVNASAHDLPDLAELWFDRTRGALNRRLAGYIETRASAGLLRTSPAPIPAARFMTELLHWFAVQRAFDSRPGPFELDEDTARETVRLAVLRTLLPAGTSS